MSRMLGLFLTLAIVAGCDALNKPMVSDAPPAAPAPPPEPMKAEAGVGKQGQSLKNESGMGRMVAQPAITLFAVKQRVVFEIQIPQAMNLYKAEKGYAPRTHDEFMTFIIKANSIKLPELPAGQVYKYDPEKAELWVYPADQPQQPQQPPQQP